MTSQHLLYDLQLKVCSKQSEIKSISSARKKKTNLHSSLMAFVFFKIILFEKKIRRPRTRSNLGVFPGSSALLNSKLMKSKL